MRNINTAEKRRAFTLIELIVVVVIMGIISAVAAPKFFSRTADAENNSARSTLSVIRSAIEQHKVDNSGVNPGTDEASFKTAVEVYLVSTFPACPAGNKNANVRVVSAGTPLTATGTQGWCYDTVTGEFRINDPSYITE